MPSPNADSASARFVGAWRELVDHARDLGIVYVTAALGQLIGPVLGAGLVALVGGFWLVFVVAAVLSLVGGGLTALARQPARDPLPQP